MMPPVGSGPAGPAVDREAFARTWTDRKVLLLGVGDSITAGFGVPMEQIYFDMLVKNPPNDDPAMKDINLSAVLPNLEAKNIAHVGQHVARPSRNSQGKAWKSSRPTFSASS